VLIIKSTSTLSQNKCTKTTDQLLITMASFIARMD